MGVNVVSLNSSDPSPPRGRGLSRRELERQDEFRQQQLLLAQRGQSLQEIVALLGAGSAKDQLAFSREEAARFSREFDKKNLQFVAESGLNRQQLVLDRKQTKDLRDQEIVIQKDRLKLTRDEFEERSSLEQIDREDRRRAEQTQRALLTINNDMTVAAEKVASLGSVAKKEADDIGQQEANEENQLNIRARTVISVIQKIGSPGDLSGGAINDIERAVDGLIRQVDSNLTDPTLSSTERIGTASFVVSESIQNILTALGTVRGMDLSSGQADQLSRSYKLLSDLQSDMLPHAAAAVSLFNQSITPLSNPEVGLGEQLISSVEAGNESLKEFISRSSEESNPPLPSGISTDFAIPERGPTDPFEASLSDLLASREPERAQQAFKDESLGGEAGLLDRPMSSTQLFNSVLRKNLAALKEGSPDSVINIIVPKDIFSGVEKSGPGQAFAGISNALGGPNFQVEGIRRSDLTQEKINVLRAKGIIIPGVD